MIGACPSHSSCSTASPGRGAAGTPVRRRGSARNAIGALAPDLRGHGDAAHARPITLRRLRGRRARGDAPGAFALCGYSLGGRLALHVALAAPERVDAPGPGLGDGRASRTPPSARARRAADEALAAEIERGTIEAFADRWTAQPLFAGDAAGGRARSRAPTSCATTPRAWRPRCAGSAPARWRRCGTGWASCRCRSTSRWSAASATRSSRRSATRLAGASRAPRSRSSPARGHGLPARRRRAARAAIARDRASDARRRRRRRSPARGHGDRPAAGRGRRIDAAKSAERREPAGQVERSAAAQCTAAAIPSGPSSVEAR